MENPPARDAQREGPRATAQQPSGDPALPDGARVILSRLSSLEHEYTHLRSTVVSSQSQDTDAIPPLGNGSRRSMPSCQPCPSHAPRLPASDVRAASSLLQLVDALDRSVNIDYATQQRPGAIALVPSGCESDPDIIEAERAIRLDNGASFRAAFPVTFLLNSCHPILNENQFRARFDDFVFDSNRKHGTIEGYQFLSLIYFVYAETELRSGHSTDPKTTLGWREYTIADRVLQKLGSSQKGDLVTLECLLVKTRYLLCAEKLDAAYEAMGVAVRICFQNNLHNERVWSLDLDGFQRTMRRCIFWATFTLERLVASTCGLPFFIRETDVRVDFPKSYNDQGLFPGQPLPSETPTCSFTPYQAASIRWARTYSIIWDSMFCVNAQHPPAADLVDALDTRIAEDANQLPSFLQWAPMIPDGLLQARVPSFMKRQRLICHMRLNHLRLLIRQQSMTSLNFPSSMADECRELAASSIETCHALLSTSHHDIDRYFVNSYLSAAMIPLACIILKQDSVEAVRSSAISFFHEAMMMLQSISTGYMPAYRMVQRFQGILRFLESFTR